MKTQISIIIPVYNTEQYLERCFASIVTQNFDNYEVILINDGSKDRSAEICKNWCEKDKRFKLINQENHGQAYSRNRGIENAVGEYIIFVDSDDWLEPEAMKYLFDRIYHDQADIVCGRYQFVSSSNKIAVSKGFTKDKGLNQENLKDALNVNNYYTAPWGKIYNRLFLIRNNLFFPEGIVNEDTSHSIECAALALKISYLNKVVASSFERDGSTSRASYIRMLDSMHSALKYAYNFLIEQGKNDDTIDALFRARYVRSMLYNLMQSAQRNNYQKFVESQEFCLSSTDYVANLNYIKFLPVKHKVLAKLSLKPKLFFSLIKILNRLGFRMH